MPPRLTLSLALFAAQAGFSQQVTVGFVGGTNVSNGFGIYESRYPGDGGVSPPSYSRRESGSRSFIAGAVIEARLSEMLSIEADVLHRPMKVRLTEQRFPPGVPPQQSVREQTAVRAWQFPVLAKLTLPTRGIVRPFLTAGPSFRTQEDVAGTEPSQFGVTTGIGATIAWKRLRFAPTLRYSRWKADAVVFPRFRTRPDQLEFLTSVAVETEPIHWRLGSHRVEFGILGGFPLTAGFQAHRIQGVVRERFRYAGGVGTQFNLSPVWAITANAVYRPLRARSDNNERPQAYSVITWQVPVLAKHSWDRQGWRPFVEAGPSLRTAGNLNFNRPSHFGGTAGCGIEQRFQRVRFTPELRFTRWAADRPLARTNPNAVELIFGAYF